MSERSLLAYEHAREASQRFEYFLLGVSTALCAYVGQTLSPQKLGLSPYTLEVASLFVLIGSVVAGFKCIEKTITCHRLNQQTLHFAEERGQLVSNFGSKPLLNTETGTIRTPEQVQKRIVDLGKALRTSHKKFLATAKVAKKYYRLRNWLLGIGFVGLVISKIVVPYFPK